MSVRSGFNLTPAGYSVLKKTVTKSDKATIRKVFMTCDEDHKGFMNKDDLKVAVVELLGYKPTSFEVNQMLETHGEHIDDVTRGMRVEPFVTCMSDKMGARDEDEEIRHTFMAFDVQCRGFLTLDDVKRVFSQVAPHVPVQTVHSAFREIDQDGDGRVSYKDFEYLMKYNVDDHI